MIFNASIDFLPIEHGIFSFSKSLKILELNHALFLISPHKV